MGDVHTILHEELWARARIRVHQGRSQVWNRGGSRPTGADALTRAQEVRPGKVISICRWILRVLRVLGAPIGTQEYVMRQLKAKSTEHAVLLDRRRCSCPSSFGFCSFALVRPVRTSV